MKTLKDTKIGTKVKVVKLHGEAAVRRRIMDMGITKGVEIYVRKVAPLGDPMELFVRGYELSFLEKLLKENKFSLIGIYEEMTTEAVKENTERAVFVARKIGTQ